MTQVIETAMKILLLELEAGPPQNRQVIFRAKQICLGGSCCPGTLFSGDLARSPYFVTWRPRAEAQQAVQCMWKPVVGFVDFQPAMI